MKFSRGEMNTTGAKALAAAIIVATAEDYYLVCNDPDDIHYPIRWTKNPTILMLMTKRYLEKFIDSNLFGVLTDIPPRVFKERIKKMKREGIPMPTLSMNGVRR